MINAEYEEIDDSDAALGLADTDNLPWLEADEEDEDAGGLDPGQIMFAIAGMVGLLAAVVGGVWYVSNKAGSGEMVADGSVIAAPEGPIKQRPDDPGGKEFAGTGNVAPVVGEGGSRPAVVADTSLPPLPGDPAKPVPAAAPTTAATKPVPAAAPAATAPATGGVAVQLAAYGTRARAEQGWSDAQKRTTALSGFKYRVVEGKVDIGTVYRLQAVAANRAEAEKLCAALKADGVDCQVK